MTLRLVGLLPNKPISNLPQISPNLFLLSHWNTPYGVTKHEIAFFDLFSLSNFTTLFRLRKTCTYGGHTRESAILVVRVSLLPHPGSHYSYGIQHLSPPPCSSLLVFPYPR
mgnify:CR=1 FL=1